MRWAFAVAGYNTKGRKLRACITQVSHTAGVDLGGGELYGHIYMYIHIPPPSYFYMRLNGQVQHPARSPTLHPFVLIDLVF